MKFRDDVYKNYRSTGKGWKKRYVRTILNIYFTLADNKQ